MKLKVNKKACIDGHETLKKDKKTDKTLYIASYVKIHKLSKEYNKVIKLSEEEMNKL